MSALRVTAQKNPPSGAGWRYTGALARNQRYCSNGCPLPNDAAEYKSIWMSGAFVLSVLVMPFPPGADAVCVDWRAKAANVTPNIPSFRRFEAICGRVNKDFADGVARFQSGYRVPCSRERVDGVDRWDHAVEGAKLGQQ